MTRQDRSFKKKIMKYISWKLQLSILLTTCWSKKSSKYSSRVRHFDFLSLFFLLFIHWSQLINHIYWCKKRSTRSWRRETILLTRALTINPIGSLNNRIPILVVADFFGDWQLTKHAWSIKYTTITVWRFPFLIKLINVLRDLQLFIEDYHVFALNKLFCDWIQAHPSSKIFNREANKINGITNWENERERDM